MSFEEKTPVQIFSSFLETVVLASTYQLVLLRSMLFLTGYRNPKSFSKQKLKPFEVHERRHRAQAQAKVLIKSLNEESARVEAKAKAGDLKLKVVEENKAAEEECARERRMVEESTSC